MMFEDDPIADKYDKYGRYYPVQTHVYQSSSLTTFEEVMAKNDNLNLFYRGDKEAQDKQLKQMNLKSNFFSKHQTYVPRSTKSNYIYLEKHNHAKKYK